jgi:hypothetical protein
MVVAVLVMGFTFDIALVCLGRFCKPLVHCSHASWRLDT